MAIFDPVKPAPYRSDPAPEKYGIKQLLATLADSRKQRRTERKDKWDAAIDNIFGRGKQRRKDQRTRIKNQERAEKGRLAGDRMLNELLSSRSRLAKQKKDKLLAQKDDAHRLALDKEAERMSKGVTTAAENERQASLQMVEDILEKKRQGQETEERLRNISSDYIADIQKKQVEEQRIRGERQKRLEKGFGQDPIAPLIPSSEYEKESRELAQKRIEKARPPVQPETVAKPEKRMDYYDREADRLFRVLELQYSPEAKQRKFDREVEEKIQQLIAEDQIDKLTQDPKEREMEIRYKLARLPKYASVNEDTPKEEADAARSKNREVQKIREYLEKELAEIVGKEPKIKSQEKIIEEENANKIAQEKIIEKEKANKKAYAKYASDQKAKGNEPVSYDDFILMDPNELAILDNLPANTKVPKKGDYGYDQYIIDESKKVPGRREGLNNAGKEYYHNNGTPPPSNESKYWKLSKNGKEYFKKNKTIPPFSTGQEDENMKFWIR